MRNPVLSLMTVVTVLILHSFVELGRGVFGQGTDHYCSRDPSDSVLEITGETEGSIYTLHQGDDHYENNQNCAWMIDAGPSNRVEITVVSSHLQWAPPSAICPGYDHVAIKDGQNGGEDTIILQWCGQSQPLGAVSSGRFVRVEFMSDKNNPYHYTGVHLRFKTFSSGDCAPSWMNSSTDFCYKLLNKETDWSSAQKECNTGGANLASLLTDQEQDLLVQSFGSLADTAWIGLNDIVYQGVYEWIDGSPHAYNRFGQHHVPNEYFRCVALRFSDGVWQLKDCEKDRLKPLCKSYKRSRTVIFPIPQARPDERDSKTPVGTIVAIVVPVLVLILLIIIGVCLCRKLKERRLRASYSSPKGPEVESQHTQAVALQETRQAAREPRMPSAPPEEHRQMPVMIHTESRMLSPPPYEEALAHPVVPPAQTHGRATYLQ